ncbi:MAG TPA: LuxR C-terminal-related transcriptional regulator, partial [Nitrospiria bacterium]|nr:LuxR C-terminal-related transcriptional regulator [Nitrospiria bacterium]
VLWRSVSRHDFSNQECFLIEQASIHCGTLLSQPINQNPDTSNAQYVKMVSKRTPPAVIILDKENKFLFINEEARTILKILNSGKALLSNNAHDLFFQKLYQARENGESVVFSFRGTLYSCRPVPLDETSSALGNVMMLIETVNEDLGSFSSVEEIFPDLSPREKTVAKLLAQGLTNKEIANRMEIGLYTVKDHIKKIMEKLHTNTRAGVVSKLKKGK